MSITFEPAMSTLYYRKWPIKWAIPSSNYRTNPIESRESIDPDPLPPVNHAGLRDPGYVVGPGGLTRSKLMPPTGPLLAREHRERESHIYSVRSKRGRPELSVGAWQGSDGLKCNTPPIMCFHLCTPIGPPLPHRPQSWVLIFNQIPRFGPPGLLPQSWDLFRPPSKNTII